MWPQTDGVLLRFAETIAGEAELLVHCARTILELDRVRRIEELAGAGLDWALVLRLAERNNVKQLLYSHLQATVAGNVPTDVLRSLRDDSDRTARRNLFLTSRLVRLLELFERNAIPLIPYKGPLLAGLVYGDLALRPFQDLDLFVRQEDACRARAVLVSAGYQANADLSPAQVAMHLRLHSEFIFQRPSTGELVELHWKLTDEYFCFSPDPEQLWLRAESVQFAGRQVLSFAPAHQLLFLCVHGAQHCWDRLEWVCGVSELIRVSGPRIDWEALHADARRLGSERMLQVGLALAHGLLGRPLPDWVTQQIQENRAVLRLARQVVPAFFDDLRKPVSNVASYQFHLASRERLRHRMAYLLRLVFTPTLGDWTFVRLPGPLRSLYYPLRWVRLAATIWRAPQ